MGVFTNINYTAVCKGGIYFICLYFEVVHTNNQAEQGARDTAMSVPTRSQIRPGLRVQIVEKQNQRSGTLTEGIVARLLTKSATHPHGIKVMLTDGRVGRVQSIVLSSDST
jgi:uncharacterized repeat protein (TIGR03833 family)